MTDRVTRLYVLVVAVLVFVVAWAAIAARPWVSAKPDPRLAALAQRQQLLRADAALVRQIVAQRTAAARTAASPTRSFASAQTSAAPMVKVVNLPPLTITKTS